MDNRLSHLEGSVEGLKHSQAMLKAGVMGFGGLVLAAVAIVVALQAFTYSRVDRVESKVDALPGQISSDIQGLTRTLSSAITAAKEQPPAVVVVPAPPQSQR